MPRQINSKVELSIRRNYDTLEGSYKLVKKEVIELIKETCDDNQWLLTHRIKNVESYYLKLTTGRNDGYFIDDFFACTIVVPSLREIEAAQKLIAVCFEIVETKPESETNNFPTNFNFDSIRNYCKLKKKIQKKAYSDFIFEIQVKTLLEHAWGKATHDFSYKRNDASWARERIAAQIKAVLDNVDISIHDMEKIAESPFLKRNNPRYDSLNKVIHFMSTDFAKNIINPLPQDLKRLSEQIERFLKRTNISLENLKKFLENETKAGRGYKITNLSAYSLIISTLVQQNPKAVEKGLSNRPLGKNPPQLVIPKEISIEDYIDISKLQYVTILE